MLTVQRFLLQVVSGDSLVTLLTIGSGPQRSHSAPAIAAALVTIRVRRLPGEAGSHLIALAASVFRRKIQFRALIAAR